MSPFVPALLIPVVLLSAGTVLVLRGKTLPSLIIAAGMLLTGMYLGLEWAPPEQMMGDVYRIIYMHVPSVWMALLAMVLNFTCSVRRLMDSRPMLLVGAGLGAATVLLGIVLKFAMADEHNARNAMIYCVTFGILFVLGAWVGSRIKSDLTADALAEASAEVGLVFGANGVLLGSIWARPTWGVWWDWDPRLTSAAILLVAYSGYLALRKFVDDADRRAVWSAVVAIVSFVDVPIIYFSVRWWRSLHQIQSSPETIPDARMQFVLRFCSFTFLLIMIIWVRQRFLIARKSLELETTVPDALPAAPAGEAA